MSDPMASTSFLPPDPPLSTRAVRQRTRTTKATLEEADFPKLKLKMGGAVSGAGVSASDPGWDREIDSDPEEPLVVEEHFILRVPPALAPKLREAVSARDVPADVWFKFKDSRRAVFHMGDKTYGAKLVDLPTLVESQKMSGSGGQSVKVADISQMLLVEDEVREEGDVTRGRAFNIEDFIYPHGITPPLKHVRKRRFRKRINKRTIEIVESAVEKLLEADANATTVQYELLDHDIASSDEEYNNEGNDSPRRPANDTDSLGAPTPRALDAGSMLGDDDGDREEEEDDEAGSGFDSDLANEINKGLEAMNASASGSGSSGDEGGLFGGSSDDEEEEEEEEEEADAETIEERRRIKLLGEEMGDLERAIAAKEGELKKAGNPIFKKRFEEMIKKLTAERDSKRSQHTSAVLKMERKKAEQDEGQAQADAAEAEEKEASAAAIVPDAVEPAQMAAKVVVPKPVVVAKPVVEDDDMDAEDSDEEDDGMDES